MHAILGRALCNRVAGKLRNYRRCMLVDPEVLSIDPATVNFVRSVRSRVHIYPPLILVLIPTRRLFNPGGRNHLLAAGYFAAIKNNLS